MVDRRGYDGKQKYTICDALKCTDASFSPNSTDSLHLQVDQVPISSNLAIFYGQQQHIRLLYPLCMRAG